jgi:hypothetical protein
MSNPPVRPARGAAVFGITLIDDHAFARWADAKLAPAAHTPNLRRSMQDALTRYAEVGAALSQISLRDIEDHLLMR